MTNGKIVKGDDVKRFVSVMVIGLSVVAVGVRADILDDIGFDDPLNFFWNRNTIITGLNQPCISSTNSGSAQGICRNFADCAFNGGQSFDRGNCNIFQTCCVFQRSCGRSSQAKISTFTSPITPTSLPENCDYRVVLMNPNVCQVRIDIINTDLAEPGSHLPLVGAETFYTQARAGECVFDYIEINNLEVSRQVPRICGKNSNQHLYVRVNPSDRYLDVHVITSNRINQPAGADLPTPSWNLKMTQLECPGRSTFLTTSSKSQAGADFPLLAPEGCLQYFTDITGEIKTFNFGGRRGYINNMDYATCFRKPVGSCGVSFALGEFALQAIATADPQQCIDYLYIPERRAIAPSNPLLANQAVCGPAVAAEWPSISSHQGPLYIHFHSDGTVVEKGYRLTYNTANNC